MEIEQSDIAPADDTVAQGGVEITPEFCICDEQSANWLIRKVVETRAYRERVKRWAGREIHRATQDEKRLLFLYESQLRAWASTEIRKLGGRRKSVNLPAGRVGYRTVGPKLVIEDVNAVLSWARAACPEAIVVKERLDKSILNALLVSSGEVPDHGAHVEPEREGFFIE